MSRCCLPQCLSFHQDKVGTDYSQIFAWDNPVERRSNGKLLCNVLDRLLKGYENKVDAEGVAVEPPMAKKRRGRRAPTKKDDSQTSQPAPDGNRGSEIRIGTVKVTAIKNLLMWVTPQAYKMMMHHSSVCGGERRSAFTEAVLAWRHLWPGSPPAEGMMPNEAEEFARRGAAAMQKKLLPDRVTSLGFALVFNFMQFLVLVFGFVGLVHFFYPAKLRLLGRSPCSSEWI